MSRKITAQFHDRHAGPPGKGPWLRVVASRSPGIPVRFRNKKGKLSDLHLESDGTWTNIRNKAAMSQCMAQRSREASSMLHNAATKTNDIAAAINDNVAMSRDQKAMWWNPISWLFGLCAMLCGMVSKWHGRRTRSTSLAERRLLREASFDELFVLEYKELPEPPRGGPMALGQSPTCVGDLLAYLALDDRYAKDRRLQLAFFLAYLQRLLRPALELVHRVHPLTVALARGVGSSALLQRPPPLAFH